MLLATICVVAYFCIRELRPQQQRENARVSLLFQQMREGSYAANISDPRSGFPELHFEDIPALLQLADSPIVLKTFPRNDVCSYLVHECCEGLVALWLIEGVRAGTTTRITGGC